MYPCSFSTWKTHANIDDLQRLFAENRPSLSTKLMGRTIELLCENAEKVMTYEFNDEFSASVRHVSSGSVEPAYTINYEAVEIDNDVFVIDYIDHVKLNSLITLILNFQTNSATRVSTTVPAEPGEAHNFENVMERYNNGLCLSRTDVNVTSFIIASDGQNLPLRPARSTRDLIGKSIVWHYDPELSFQHMYINEHFYTWVDNEGRVESDYCSYYDIGPDLFLFTFQEKILSVAMVIVLNLKDLQSVGNCFGYYPLLDSVSLIRVGAKAESIENLL